MEVVFFWLKAKRSFVYSTRVLNFCKNRKLEFKTLYQWWRIYGTRARVGAHSPLCGHAHRRSSTKFVIRKAEGRGASLFPKSGQSPKITLLRRGELVNFPVLKQEHSFSHHVTLEIITFGNTTVSYNTVFGNTILFLDGKLVSMDLLCFYERRVEPEHWQAYYTNQMFRWLLKHCQW